MTYHIDRYVCCIYYLAKKKKRFDNLLVLVVISNTTKVNDFMKHFSFIPLPPSLFGQIETIP